MNSTLLQDLHAVRVPRTRQDCGQTGQLRLHKSALISTGYINVCIGNVSLGGRLDKVSPFLVVQNRQNLPLKDKVKIALE